MLKGIFVSGLAVVLTAVTACSGGAPPPAQQQSAPPASVATSAPEATRTAAPTSALPSDIPIMANATDLKVNDSDISFVIKSDLKSVMDFYSKELPGKGWKIQEESAIIGSIGRMNYENPGHQLSITLSYSEPLNQVVVRINIITLSMPGQTTVK